MNSSDTHFDLLKKLLEIEEFEEIQEFKESFIKLSPEERELTGKSLLRMKPLEFHFSPGAHRLIRFGYAETRALPIYSPEPGDMLSVAPSGEIRDRPLIGTVYDKDRESITLAFREDLDEDAIDEDATFDLNLSSSRNTYKKMYETLRKVKEARNSRISYFRDLSLGLKSPESYDPLSKDSIPFLNSKLNDWQKEAVAKALGAKDIFVLHGPPGTGKTTALVEIIQQEIQNGKFVFATAPSNTACDQLVTALAAMNVSLLRLGHPARIMGHLREHTLDFKLASHPLNASIREIEARVEQLLRRKERRKDRRSMSYDDRTALWTEIRELRQDIRKIGDSIWNQVVQSASVIIGTHTSGDDPILKTRPMDLLVMDEASQALEPLAWIPILSAKKIILAGDHYQLPPTVKSKEAENKGLGKTIFERIHAVLGEEWKSLLRTQYRMHEKIMNFSSQMFYDKKLIADESVRDHKLSDFSSIQKNPDTEEVFTFLDTAGCGFEEKFEPGSGSRFNPEEAKMILTKADKLIQSGVDPKQIAIISPYSAQVRLISSQIGKSEIEIDTVDGFQGREKEVILVTLVRSNCEGDLGFLNDTRRMNVALTRAKRKLFIIGDSATLSSLPFYKSLLNYADSIGAWKSFWEETE